MQCKETNALYYDNEKHLKLIALLQFLWFNKHDKYEGEERMCPFHYWDNSPNTMAVWQ